MEKITVLFNKNNSDYINWQSELLYYSFLIHHKNDKNIEFMSIVMSEDKPVVCDYPYYLCNINSNAGIVEGDDYIIYDRAFSIKNFLENTKSETERTFLLVEADFLFLKPFNIISNNTLGQKYGYMDVSSQLCRKVIDYYKNKINSSLDIEEYYRPVGWPFLIKERLLSSIVDRWIELNIKFRSTDPKNNPLYKNWICDMFGFNISLAEKKIVPDVIDIMEMPPYDGDKSAIFCHYCFGIEHCKEVIFDKRSYNPWNKINYPHNIGIDSKKLIEFINQYVDKKGEINENNCL